MATETMIFEFVDNNTTIDRTSRRRIRSHVALRRNTGESIIRPSREKTFGLRGIKTITAPISVPKLVESARDFESSDETTPEIERQVGDGLSIPSFSEQPTPGSKRLFQKVFAFMSGPRFTPELRNVINRTESTRSIWVQLMFLDKAYFHGVVALSITTLNNLTIMQEDPIDVMYHLSQAFRFVNERLSGKDAVSDTNIAVIVIMSKYEHMRGQGCVHLQGLQRMVELRGGISQLARNEPALTQKILRADLECSLRLGSATRFSIEDVVPGGSAVFRFHSSFQIQDDAKISRVLDSRFLRHLKAGLRNLMIDFINLAWLLNEVNAGHQPKLNGYVFHDTLIFLGYRLVHISPLGGPRPETLLENAAHLGLVAFILTILRELDHSIMYSPILVDLARLAAQEPFGNEQESQEVLLWLLFIGKASIFGRQDDLWLIPKATQTMYALDLHSWDDVHRTLAKFPWVNVLHDKAGQWLASTSPDRSLAEAVL